MKKLPKILMVTTIITMIFVLSACFLLKPPAPTDLKATAINAFSIKLSWKGVGDFIIYRALARAGMPFTVIATTTSTTFLDSNLTPKTTYYYQVRAQNKYGLSEPSNIASATTKFIYSVRGHVEDEYAYGIPNVTISFTGGFSSVTTDQYGGWSKSGLSGTVVITPQKSGWTFTPEHQTVSATNYNVYFMGKPSTPSSIVIFPDPVLDSIIRKQIGKPTGDIYKSELTPIATIVNNWPSTDASTIRNLEGIQYCVNLKTLEIIGNKVSNVSMLASLTKLEDLKIWYNNVSDISAIKSLTSIKKLYLDYNPIPKSNWAFLKQWTWLKELGMGGMGLINSDITFLSKFSNLEWLQLFNNTFDDLSPIASLTNLRVLLIQGNRTISDISALSNLTNLEDLSAGGNLIMDITPLKNLTKLKILSFHGDKLIDISPLASLTNLRTIDISYNSIEDISTLEGLINLSEIDLSHNKIEDIASLVKNSGIGSGDYLDIRYNLLDLTPSSTDMNNISALQKRGVNVLYDPQS